MALIKCPECGKEISEKAVACPNCGCPISDKNVEVSGIATNEITPTKLGPKKSANPIAGIPFIIFGIAMCVYGIYLITVIIGIFVIIGGIMMISIGSYLCSSRYPAVCPYCGKNGKVTGDSVKYICQYCGKRSVVNDGYLIAPK